MCVNTVNTNNDNNNKKSGSSSLFACNEVFDASLFAEKHNTQQTLEAREKLNNLITRVSNTDKVSGIAVAAFGGSISYGLDTPTSDIDIRGAFYDDATSIIMGCGRENIELKADGDDTILYSVHKLLDLLSACNPNVIEVLGLRDEHILVTSPFFETIKQNKDAFISSKCANTFGGYATMQLRRIKNALSQENNGAADAARRSIEAASQHFGDRYKSFGENGSTLTVSVLDAALGANGLVIDAELRSVSLPQAKGIFNDLNEIAKNADNLAARNRKKAAGKLSKHMSHLIRLLRMGSELLETGEVNTYRATDKQFLLELKNGLWFYENENGDRNVDNAFWDLLEEEEKRFNYAEKNTSLPNKPNRAVIDEILYETQKDIVLREFNK